MANILTRFFRRKLIPSLFKDMQSEIQAQVEKLDKKLDVTVGKQTESIQREVAARFSQIACTLDRIDVTTTVLATPPPVEPDVRNPFENLDGGAAKYRTENPELDLMTYLYAFLPNRNIIDIGANVGDVSEHLLDTGFSVYAFEPFPPVFEKLSQRLAGNPEFHPAQMAIGSKDDTMDLSIAVDPFEGKYGDTTVYNTLLPRDSADDLVFKDKVSVTVRSLDSLHKTGEIPEDVGMVKIDTEGYDLEVIRGMGDHQYPVVNAEFWAKDFTFGKDNSLNHLEDMVPEMRKRGYHWNLICCRVEGVEGIAFYLNTMRTPPKAWGNVFFFREAALFQHAAEWHGRRMILSK